MFLLIFLGVAKKVSEKQEQSISQISQCSKSWEYWMTLINKEKHQIALVKFSSTHEFVRLLRYAWVYWLAHRPLCSEITLLNFSEMCKFK